MHRRLGVVIGLGLACGLAAGVPAQETAPPGVIARVNGKPLTQQEFLRRCETKVGGVTDTAVGHVVLREWVEQVLLEEEAGRRKLLPSEEDIDRRIKAVRKTWEFRGQDFDEWLADHGRTPAVLREETRQQLIAENVFTEGIVISDAELATGYSGKNQLFGLPAQLRVSRITIEEKKDLDKVEAALKKGVLFEQLARQYSQDEYREAGGRIPVAVIADPKAEGPLEDPVLKAALDLELRKPSGAIKVDDYWVFVRVDERIPARHPPLSDVADLLRASFKVQKAGPDRMKDAQERLLILVRNAKVEIFRPEYRSVLRVFQPKIGS